MVTSLMMKSHYLHGYSIVRLDRNRHGGGILIYIRSSLSFHVTVCGPFDLEIIFVTIHLSVNKSYFWVPFIGNHHLPPLILMFCLMYCVLSM